jgi:hypothetical protein
MDAARLHAMDQGAAAVWAAAVAGLSSAVGAAIGAVAAGRAGRVTVVQTAVEGRRDRYEEQRRQSYQKYLAKINAACEAFDVIVHRLQAGPEDAIEESPAHQVAFAAMSEVELSYLSDVWPCGQREVIVAAGAVHDHLLVAREIIDDLLGHPEDARDKQSRRMQRWIDHRGEVRNAHMLYSTCVSQALYTP